MFSNLLEKIKELFNKYPSMKTILIILVIVFYKAGICNTRAVINNCFSNNINSYCEIGYSANPYRGGGYDETFDLTEYGEIYLDLKNQNNYSYSIYGGVYNQSNIKVFIDGFELKDINKSKSYYKIYEDIFMKTSFVYKLPKLEENKDYKIKIESAGCSEIYILHTYSLLEYGENNEYITYNDFDDYFKDMYDRTIEDLYAGENKAPDAYNIVFVTETGSKYHVADCGYLTNGGSPMYLKDATLSKYLPCKVCILKN